MKETGVQDQSRAASARKNVRQEVLFQPGPIRLLKVTTFPQDHVGRCERGA